MREIRPPLHQGNSVNVPGDRDSFRMLSEHATFAALKNDRSDLTRVANVKIVRLTDFAYLENLPARCDTFYRV